MRIVENIRIHVYETDDNGKPLPDLTQPFYDSGKIRVDDRGLLQRKLEEIAERIEAELKKLDAIRELEGAEVGK